MSDTARIERLLYDIVRQLDQLNRELRSLTAAVKKR